MRLFLAFRPGRQALEQLCAIEQKLMRLAPGANFVPPDHFHVTLRFLGESDRIGELALALREGVRGIRPFELFLAQYGSFSRGEKRISYVSLGGDMEELRALHQSLEAALDTAGFGRESRPLKPHITLAREVRHGSAEDRILRDFPLDASFRVDSLTLFESRREKGRQVYLPLHTEKF